MRIYDGNIMDKMSERLENFIESLNTKFENLEELKSEVSSMKDNVDTKLSKLQTG